MLFVGTPLLLENRRTTREKLPLPLLNYPLFSILLLQDYLVFLLFLLFPPTPQPLEMLAADFQGPSSLQQAGNPLPFGLNSRTPPCPLLHTQTGSEDLIAAGECCKSVYFPWKRTFCCVRPVCSLWHVNESADLLCWFKAITFSFFIATYKLETGWEYGGGRLHVFPMSTKSLEFFFGPASWESECSKGSHWVIPSAFALAGNFLGASEQEKIDLIRKKIKMAVVGVHWILQNFRTSCMKKKSAWEKKKEAAQDPGEILLLC